MLPTSILGFIDSSVVNVALPKVKSELGVGFEASQWVANAYLLTLAGLILFGGSVGDTFGQRRTFILALSGFAAASIARGLAPTAGALVVLRGMPGAAAAFLFQRASPWSALRSQARTAGGRWGPGQRRERSRLRLTPRLGWLVDVVGWRSVFFLNASIAAALALGKHVRPNRPDRGAASIS